MNWTRCTIAAVVITLGFGIPGCRSCSPVGPMPKRGPANVRAARAIGVDAILWVGRFLAPCPRSEDGKCVNRVIEN